MSKRWEIENGGKETSNAARVVVARRARAQDIGAATHSGENHRPQAQALGRRGTTEGVCDGAFAARAAASLPAQVTGSVGARLVSRVSRDRGAFFGRQFAACGSRPDCHLRCRFLLDAAAPHPSGAALVVLAAPHPQSAFPAY